MSQGMMNFLGGILGRGVATGGTKTTLIDTRKVFEADIFNGTIIKINIDGIDYYRTVVDTADSTLTFAALPGAPPVAAWATLVNCTITVTSITDGVTAYTLTAALATGNNQPLSCSLVGNVITILLATGAAGLSNDLANTTTLVTAAIDALAQFTATEAGAGIGGVVAATTGPIAFTGGVIEVKPTSTTRYQLAVSQIKIV